MLNIRCTISLLLLLIFPGYALSEAACPSPLTPPGPTAVQTAEGKTTSNGLK